MICFVALPSYGKKTSCVYDHDGYLNDSNLSFLLSVAVQVVKHTSTMPSPHFQLSATSHHPLPYIPSNHFQSPRVTVSPGSQRLECLKPEIPDQSDPTSMCDGS